MSTEERRDQATRSGPPYLPDLVYWMERSMTRTRECSECGHLINRRRTVCPYCQSNCRGDPGADPLLEHPCLTITMVLYTTVWIMVTLEVGSWSGSKYDMPYNEWWILWLLDAMAAIPVFGAALRLHKRIRRGFSMLLSLIAFLLPLVLALYLLLLALECTDFSAVNTYGGAESCPSHPVTRGWVWMGVAFGVLWMIAVYVLRTDRLSIADEHLMAP